MKRILNSLPIPCNDILDYIDFSFERQHDSLYDLKLVTNIAWDAIQINKSYLDIRSRAHASDPMFRPLFTATWKYEMFRNVFLIYLVTYTNGMTEYEYVYSDQEFDIFREKLNKLIENKGRKKHGT